MITKTVLGAFMQALREASPTNLPNVTAKVVDELDKLCVEYGYDQSEILQVRKVAEEVGAETSGFQSLLEKTKMDNIRIPPELLLGKGIVG